MKSKIIITIAILFTIMLVAPQALALEIQVDNKGIVRFYDDSILGKNINSVTPSSISRPDAQTKPIKTVTTYENKQIYLKPGSDKTAVEVRKLPSTTVESIGDKENFVSTEVMSVDHVEMNFPAQLTADQIETAKEKRGEIKEKHQEYLQKLQQMRQERHQETVEVRNRAESGENILELKSRHATALLKDGAEFQLDPTTNQVVITTPAGQEHILNHLPDQAIERMEEAGFFNSDEGIEEEVEVKIYDNGELFYHKQDKISKRLFGVVPIQIDSEIVLNDSTGEVIEKELVSDSIFTQFLNAVSF